MFTAHAGTLPRALSPPACLLAFVLTSCRYELPWEDNSFEYPASLAPPLQILIDASNGASDYGNKFGEPLVAGYTRTFGQRLPGGDRREWIKPIMFRHAADGWCGAGALAKLRTAAVPACFLRHCPPIIVPCCAACVLQRRPGPNRPQPPLQERPGAGHAGGEDRRPRIPHRHGRRRCLLSALWLQLCRPRF